MTAFLLEPLSFIKHFLLVVLEISQYMTKPHIKGQLSSYVYLKQGQTVHSSRVRGSKKRETRTQEKKSNLKITIIVEVLNCVKLSTLL